MRRLKILALWCLCTVAAAAQNNPIFGGGVADGWNRTAYVQTANNIFTGGSGDGFNHTGFQQTAVNIFIGGNSDGWAKDSFRQAVVNIYAGGSGDGWSFAPFLQAGNAIFGGGQGDGWSYANYLQAGNSIFSGGAGDGWANTYRPLGALPVTFTVFTAQKRGSVAALNWQTSSELSSASFDVERSTDAVNFTKIGNVPAAGNSSVPRNYSFTDFQPVSAYNHYRLKQLDRNGAFVYTPVRTVLFDAAAVQAIRAYPVPTKGLLTVELPAILRNEEAALNVVNSLGTMVQHVRLPRGRNSDTQALDLTGLPAGVYKLQAVSKSFNGSTSIVKQ